MKITETSCCCSKADSGITSCGADVTADGLGEGLNDSASGDASGGGRTTHRDSTQKRALINRLRRIEGQIRGIISMLENDAYCNDILQQSAAASSAIHAFNQELLSAHIKGCVVNDIKQGDDAVVDELVRTIRKLMK